MENLIKLDEFGVPPFWETNIWRVSGRIQDGKSSQHDQEQGSISGHVWSTSRAAARGVQPLLFI